MTWDSNVGSTRFLLKHWGFCYEHVEKNQVALATDNQPVSQSISRGAELRVCDWPKMFLTSKFSYLLFSTPPIKLKLGLQQIGERLLIATHLDKSNYLANHEKCK